MMSPKRVAENEKKEEEESLKKKKEEDCEICCEICLILEHVFL